MYKKILTLVGITILFLGTWIIPSIAIDNLNKSSIPLYNGNTLYVGGSGEGNYTSIQDAINDTLDGDTVFVYDDSSPYIEHISIGKSIYLIGENRNTTVIDSKGYDVLNIYKDKVTINGFKIISYDMDGCGIYIDSSDNVTISNNYITINGHAIIGYSSNNNKIVNNIITNNPYGGIAIWDSNNNIIKGNKFSDNTYGGIQLDWYGNDNYILDNTFVNDGIITFCCNNIIENNTVNDKPLLYLENESDKVIDYDVGQIILVKCDNITVKNLNLSNTCVGIELLESINCNISNNYYFNNNDCGVFFSYSNYNTLLRNSISSKNDDGIFIYKSNNNTIAENEISNNKRFGVHFMHSDGNNIIENNIDYNNFWGLSFSNSDDNIIKDNYIRSNDKGINIVDSSFNIINDNNIISNEWGGISIKSSDNNIISDNNILLNNIYGISVGYSSNNKIYHNRLKNIQENAEDYYGNNSWDDGYPSGGNYWDDYTGEDADGDGIGDTPYTFDNGEDKYPLMEPYGNNPPEPPIISGPTHGKPRIDYNYTFVTTDPDGDYVWYHICWGDKEQIYIYGPYPSGENLTLSYNWTNKGTYTITCLTIDIYDAVSNVTGLEVTIPKARVSNLWYELLVKCFPMLGRLLNFLR